jgi:hypothetical protein
MQNVPECSGTFKGIMIITIFLKLIWHSCRRESKEMSHGRRAVKYQCPSRDDEGNDYGESEGQCGPYQEPQGFGKVPEHSGTFCMRPDPNNSEQSCHYIFLRTLNNFILREFDPCKSYTRTTYS